MINDYYKKVKYEFCSEKMDRIIVVSLENKKEKCEIKIRVNITLMEE